ncbi:sigma-70 family RNA polymerase sigma factor [Falsirhodobacter sp. 20TX0035]|uniref:sigma-70 family RNA polymerase sigma factor n=1 Tax=Falsirhodobacter sp. 20TX0035 TaxID=3022019 RepID=UPI00232C1670|nr:sigma-70 family RNA polymerase sigma factor [Falsirhodobacter sp. 20TX0035]MDB6454947.1 sigma-70 family RNA polymerase sigma factor [Falsirhodobacter sp. 20TX0035]
MRPDAVATFETQRPRLLRLAYRMLGSHAEAEDMVQEAWLRWQNGDHGQIAEPAAWLTRVVSRLCLDQMKSARARRETYPGTWLPEPLIEEADDALRPDNLTLSLMLALERLSPLERAAFLLHDVFGQPMDDVAGTIGRSPAATRQLAARARAHVQIDRPRYDVSRAAGEELARAFFHACKTGDAAALSAMLASGATLHSDGGGKVVTVLNVIEGVENLLRLFENLARKVGDGMEFLGYTVIDGLPGFVSRQGGTIQTTALEVEDGRITRIYITRNPDKLTGLAIH